MTRFDRSHSLGRVPTLTLLSMLVCSARAGTRGSIVVQARAVRLFLPDCLASASNATVRTVVSYHGWGGDGGVQADTDNFEALADEDCVLLAYPTGYARGDLWFATGYAWAAGGCCPTRGGGLSFSDDVGFTRELLTALHATYPALNPKLNFLVGVSNGGMMSNRAACVLGDLISGFASVSGPLVNGTESDEESVGETFECTSSRIPMFHVHGARDPIVPLGGCSADGAAYGIICPLLHEMTTIAPFPPIREHVDDWRRRNGVFGEEAVMGFINNTVACESWATSPLDNVTLCIASEGGHSWPGHIDSGCDAAMFACTEDMSASIEIFRFFRAIAQRTSS